MCAGLMDNEEGLDSSRMHSNGHTHNPILVGDHVLVLAVYHSSFKDGQDKHIFLEL